MTDLKAPAPSPRRRFGPGLLALVLVLGIGLGGGTVLLARRGDAHRHADPSEATRAEKDLYVCPMHPTITSDHPGDCPICGMKLVKVASDSAGTKAAKGERRIAFYRSPMDPKQTSPTPRKDEMGMGYLPVYEDEVSGDGSSKVEGLATVKIDPQRQQIIGLRTAAVSSGSVGGSWR